MAEMVKEELTDALANTTISVAPQAVAYGPLPNPTPFANRCLILELPQELQNTIFSSAYRHNHPLKLKSLHDTLAVHTLSPKAYKAHSRRHPRTLDTWLVSKKYFLAVCKACIPDKSLPLPLVYGSDISSIWKGGVLAAFVTHVTVGRDLQILQPDTHLRLANLQSLEVTCTLPSMSIDGWGPSPYSSQDWTENDFRRTPLFKAVASFRGLQEFKFVTDFPQLEWEDLDQRLRHNMKKLEEFIVSVVTQPKEKARRRRKPLYAGSRVQSESSVLLTEAVVETRLRMAWKKG